MCGRSASYRPGDDIRRIFGTVNPPPNLPPSWNVAPTDKAIVVRLHPEKGERRLDVLACGLVPHFTSDLKAARRPINARSETAALRNSPFGPAFASRRCIVPAEAFY